MTEQEKLYTVEEFLALAELPENADRRLELIDGVLVDMPPSSKRNTFLGVLIAHFLLTYVLPRQLGIVSGADGGFVIGPNHIFEPGVAYISRARAGGVEGKVFPVAPDLAVEVISPGESARQVANKVRAYLKAGTRLVWTVYPEDEVVDVHRLAEEDSLITQRLTVTDTLTGGAVLPEFQLPLADLFNQLKLFSQETTQE